MASVAILEENKPTQLFPLGAGGVSIGRSGQNDILLNDSTVSSQHARIYTYFDASYIEDLNSTNGTYINGKAIQKHLIKPGDVIRIGRKQLKIES